MALNELRATVLEIINEAQRKLGLNASSTLSENSQVRVLLDFLNDTIDEVSDMDWVEAYATAVVTAASGVADYSITTSAVIRSIEDIYFGSRTAPLISISVSDMRQRQRMTGFGTPTQFAINGADANGNPAFQVWPRPSSTVSGQLFNVLYRIKPPIYTTSDASVIPPYPAKALVYGILVKALLDESGGAPTQQTQQYQALYEASMRAAVNRFQFRTGNAVRIRPS